MKKTTHIVLWIAQILLSLCLIWAGIVKLFQPIDQLETMWPWTGEVSPALVKLTGIIDLLGALGLLLPSLFKFKPILTPIAAIGIILLMIAASVFHTCRGEGSQIGFNIVVAVISAFIAYGRLKLAPIQSK
ncbi:MAG: hypothetical protein K0S23_3716 [Fluviicola sp.]|jgi:uncharacterized membrane protein|uniref:DoxX family protein n=1 Tax=Fluviicola sp. TaxID=1917219 RepID=UPI00261F02E6|nr:DoxX family protein [Fluviicola sp.]MDF3029409.1 hypothetical protein [Fluviicola sp.]